MSTQNNAAEKASNLAYRYEQEKEHCAQATLAAIMESINNVDEVLFRAADGLTGGTALSTEGTCGALAAGILAISMFTGRKYKNFKTDKPGHTWEYVTQLCDRFIDEYGGPTGSQVQKKLFGKVYLLREESAREKFNKAGAHIDKCPSVCSQVAKWSVEIINEILNER